MDVTSTCFYYISQILENELVGGYINNVQNINDQTLKIKIHKKQTKQLIITKELCFLSNEFLSTEASGGFIKFLKKKLYNQKIQDVKRDKDNRLLYFVLDKYILIVEFFSKSNIILTDKDFKIISARENETWKDRVIKKNEIYKFPAGKDITETDDAKLKEDLQQITDTNKKLDKKNIISFFVKEYNLHPVLLENLWLNTEPDLTIITIVKKIRELYLIKNPKLYIIPTMKKTVSVFESKNPINASDFFSEIIPEYNNLIETKDAKITISKLTKITQILHSQENAREEFIARANLQDIEGAFIYAHFTIIDKINRQINLAIAKKIPVDEITNAINIYFKNKNIDIFIKKIDLKTKKYILSAST